MSVSRLGGLALFVLISMFQLAAAKDITRADWKAAPAVASRNMEATRDNAAKAEAERRGKRQVYRLVVEERMPERKAAAYITVHHSAFSFKKSMSFEESLLQWQKNLIVGYYIDLPKLTKHIYLGDIPYHYIISRDGQVAEGRELKYSAYSNTIYKSDIAEHVTIVLDGNFNFTTPTKDQTDALVTLLERLARAYKIPLNRIDYHSHVADSDCPGKNLIRVFPEIKKQLAHRGI